MPHDCFWGRAEPDLVVQLGMIGVVLPGRRIGQRRRDRPGR